MSKRQINLKSRTGARPLRQTRPVQTSDSDYRLTVTGLVTVRCMMMMRTSVGLHHSVPKLFGSHQ